MPTQKGTNMLQVQPERKEAAGRAATAATDVHQEAYQPPAVPSSSNPRTNGIALGMLLLGLQRPGLPKFVRHHAWGLVEQWTRKLVDDRLAGSIAR
jgi:hypothetical protein